MVSQPAPPPKLFHPATFFKVRSNFPSRFRFVLKHLHFRAYLPRFVVSMRNAGPSAGQNRRSFLQRCTLFGQAALARRVQWTKQPGRSWRSAPVFASALRGAPQNRLSARGLNLGPKRGSHVVQKPKKHCHAWPVKTFRASNGGTGVFLNGFCPPLRLVNAPVRAMTQTKNSEVPTRF